MGREVEGRPLLGLFDSRHPHAGACVLGERVHCIGFVAGNTPDRAQIRKATDFCANRGFFQNKEKTAAALSCPLKVRKRTFYRKLV
jgi:hypothetical protein